MGLGGGKCTIPGGYADLLALGKGPVGTSKEKRKRNAGEQEPQRACFLSEGNAFRPSGSCRARRKRRRREEICKLDNERNASSSSGKGSIRNPEKDRRVRKREREGKCLAGRKRLGS